jgi:hypothetical protein
LIIFGDHLIFEQGWADRPRNRYRRTLGARHLLEGFLRRTPLEVIVVCPVQAVEAPRIPGCPPEGFLAPHQAVVGCFDRLMRGQVGRIQMLDNSALPPRQIALHFAWGAMLAKEGKGCLEAGLQLEGQLRVGRHEVDGVIPKRHPGVEPDAATVKLGSLLSPGVSAGPAIVTGLAGDPGVLLLYALVVVGLSAPRGTLFRRQIPAALPSAGTDR